MNDPTAAAAARYDRIAAAFTDRVRAVPDDAWDRPAPCEGWVARDLQRPPVDEDPVAAWAALDVALRDALDDPSVAGSEQDTPMGRSTFAATLDMIATTDVFLHTWDLARATGGDEHLDPDEVHRLLVGMEPMDEVLRSSGHYGPRTPVPADADEQTRLLAFIGRVP
jgi:uncharacterized protein (TIGR03086 family)